MKITQQQLADAIYVPFQRVNELVNGKRGVTPSTSLRLAKFFGVSADYWMNLQVRWDLHIVRKKEQEILEKIEPIKVQPAGE
jgi:addiction module HigA family antidote